MLTGRCASGRARQDVDYDGFRTAADGSAAVTPALAGRTALVTGGASGIGRAVARRLAALGARVTIADIDEGRAGSVAAEIDGDVRGLDLADPAALDGVYLEVDVLVNNAGIQHVAPIDEFDPAMFHRI
jgi:3-hydroxybutyrate dehydrogenase